MSSPGETEVRQFARKLFSEHVVIPTPEHKINTQTKFLEYLQASGFPKITSFEFAERNLGFLLQLIVDKCNEWDDLDLKSPLHILNQTGNLITWPHPKFTEISGKTPLSGDYCAILQAIRNAKPREFLGYVACYLYAIGCTRIFITDTSGDGGIDLLGSFSNGNLRNICIFVQSKSSGPDSQLNKEVLLSEYSKFLLLRRLPKWSEYCKCTGVDSSISGMGSIFMFLSNSEFKPGLQDAASALEIVLRSGRQVASALASLGPFCTLKRAIDALTPFEVNLSKNLHSVIGRNL
ncbi:MAG: hypothetical protein QM627_12225 [Luteolibacter sp.]